jgi:hypothetical protein
MKSFLRLLVDPLKPVLPSQCFVSSSRDWPPYTKALSFSVVMRSIVAQVSFLHFRGLCAEDVVISLLQVGEGLQRILARSPGCQDCDEATCSGRRRPLNSANRPLVIGPTPAPTVGVPGVWLENVDPPRKVTVKAPPPPKPTGSLAWFRDYYIGAIATRPPLLKPPQRKAL